MTDAIDLLPAREPGQLWLFQHYSTWLFFLVSKIDNISGDAWSAYGCKIHDSNKTALPAGMSFRTIALSSGNAENWKLIDPA